jgi:hypothetical protein
VGGMYVCKLVIYVDENPNRGRPKKRWIDRNNMRIKRVSIVMTSYGREGKRKTIILIEDRER